jgi:osmotically-inducible protein OsmY
VSRCLLVLPVILLLAQTVGGCRAVGPYEDARIEAEIKARLVAEKDANLTRLGVVSNGGVVYLSGSVQSAEEMARAAALARVQGVRRVVNTLDVRPAPQ